VAICDQLGGSKTGKKNLSGGVLPKWSHLALALNDTVLEHRENNFLACVHIDKSAAGVAFLDISTGEFLTAEGTFEYVDKLLNNFVPKEVLFERANKSSFHELFGHKFFTYKLDELRSLPKHSAQDKLTRHFETRSLKGFGISGMKLGIVAAGAILQYLDITQHLQVKTHHIPGQN